MRSRLFPYLLLAPYALFFLTFLAYPIVRGVYISLFDWGIFGPNAFLGLANYRDLFTDERFLQSLGATATLALIYVPMMLAVSLLLAVLLHRALPGIAIFRTVFFLPIVINVAAAAIAVGWVIDPEIGVLNRLLGLVGLPGQAWLSQPVSALFAVSLVTLWINAGFMIIILLAGLENIPDELYEAARIDGSNPLQNLIYITIPMLRPILLLVAILSIIDAFQVFGEVHILTEGGPFGSTHVLTLMLFEEGFEKFALGRAAAIGVIITAIIASLSFLQFRIFRER